MEIGFTETQSEIRELARQIAEEQVKPVRAKLDEEEVYPREIMKLLGEVGLSGVYIPEEYGGLGGGITELCIVTEELSRICLGVSTAYAGSGLGTMPLLVSGNEDQRKRYLPKLASGEYIGAFCLTEAAAGSDAAALQTTATKDGTDWILNGTKLWVTNGGEADLYTIVAVTDKTRGMRGVSAFLVEKGSPGFTFGKKEKKLGIRCSATCECIFDECKVPSENLLGREGAGFVTTIKTLDQARIGVGAQAVGLSQGALEEALHYSRVREQFGKPIASFQAIQHMLADMATEIEAARAFLYHISRAVDKGTKSFSRHASMIKLFASEMAMRITVDAVQIFGGYGFMRDYPVEKMMRDAKILQIYEGTNQIQRNNIALDLIQEDASRRKRKK
ncbi:acyl-CoA dehydrogenase family protein [Acidobacteriota bacterium]